MQNNPSMATDRQTCPRCGFASVATGSSGLCPRCLWASSLLRDDPDPWLGFSDETGDSAGRSSPAPSKLLAGCELIEEIARGGMGVVYQARQTALNRTVAVKVLAGGPFASPEFLGRFRAEAGTAARLKHPNIVAIHEIGEEDGVAFFTMDFVDGPNLAQRAREEPFLPREAAACVETVARAVAYAHSQGVLHRDLKPSNILLDLFGQPQITDFGLAKQLVGTRSTASEESTGSKGWDVVEHVPTDSLTLTGQSLGSPGYAAPEQIRAGQADARSDVYGLGATLYHLLTGRPPFAGATVVETLRAAQDDDPVSPRALNPTVPPDLETVCLKCLEKEPAKRYATAQDLADDLERFLNDEPILARPVTRVERLGRWCRRKPALATSLLTILLLLIIVMIGSPIAAYRINTVRQEAVLQARNARLNQYAADINLAADALWTRQRPGRTRQLLSAWIPQGREDLRGWEWHYLWGEVQPDYVFLLGENPDSIRSLALSPNGALLASSDWSGTVSLWNLSTRTRLMTFQEPSTVHRVQFYSDQILITAQANGTFTLYDTADGSVRRRLEAGTPLLTLEVSPARDRLAVMTTREQFQAVKVWRVTPSAEPGGLPEFIPAYQTPDVPEPRGWHGRGALAFSPSGRELAAGYTDGSIRLLDTASGTTLRTLTGHTDALAALAFSSDGRWLASGAVYGDVNVRVWDVATGNVVAVLPAAVERSPRAVAFSGQDNFLFVASGDSTVKVWNTSDWSLARTLLGHEAHVNAVIPGFDNEILYSGGTDKQLLAWNLSQPKRQLETVSIPGLRGFDWSPSGQHIATVEPATGNPARSQVYLRNSRNLDGRRTLPALGADALDVSFSRSGTLLAAVTAESLGIYDVTQDRLVRRDPLPSAEPPILAGFTAGDSALVLIQPDSQIVLWDVAQGRVQDAWSTLLDPARPITLSKWCVALHAESGLLALSGNGLISVWDIRARVHRGFLQGHSFTLVHLAFSNDGSMIVSAGGDGRINLWDARPLALRKELPLLEDSAFAATISPDHRRVAVGRHRGHGQSNISIVDLETGRELFAIRASDGLVRQLAWSPDGTTLISRLNDGQAWSIRVDAPSFDQP
jgi:WD40 repeat protein